MWGGNWNISGFLWGHKVYGGGKFSSVYSCTVSVELVTGSGISGGEEGGVDAMFAATIHLRRKGLSRSQGRTRLYDTIFGFESEEKLKLSIDEKMIPEYSLQ
ncbi:hypothetical protein L195_g047901 [Trifolium pratense]|uniref:Uncharacterized protein n=1 Tax=Trifolium pratense TaxID=57577 RepID=A0A2K3MLT0_TRIPR|nr:hypothetical protein L195_g047901 [Trifolium pratense]